MISVHKRKYVLSVVCAGTCDRLLLGSGVVQYNIVSSSDFDSDHDISQLILGTLPINGKAGFWQAASNDGNQYIEV